MFQRFRDLYKPKLKSVLLTSPGPVEFTVACRYVSSGYRIATKSPFKAFELKASGVFPDTSCTGFEFGVQDSECGTPFAV